MTPHPHGCKISGNPAFLDNYALGGFQLGQSVGETGVLVLYLHACTRTEQAEFADLKDIQAVLGEQLECDSTREEFRWRSGGGRV